MIDPMTTAPERIGRRDIAIAAVLSLLGLLLMYDNVYGVLADERADPTSDAHSVVIVGGLLPIEFSIPLFLAVTVPLLWRRAAPVVAVGATRLLAGLLDPEDRPQLRPQGIVHLPDRGRILRLGGRVRGRVRGVHPPTLPPPPTFGIASRACLQRRGSLGA